MNDKEQLDRIEAKLDSLILLVAARGIGQPQRPAPAPAHTQQYAPAQAQQYAPAQTQQYAPAQTQQYAPAQAQQAPQYGSGGSGQQYAPAAPQQYTQAPGPPAYRPPSAGSGQSSQFPQSTAPIPPSDGPVASDEDLDSKYGNPEVRKDPSRWKGESMVGRRFSDCSADYLEVLAALFDWRAEQDEKKGDARSKWARLDAARARGWARRARGGGEGGPALDPAFTQGPGFAPPAAPPRAASRSVAIAAGENPDAEPAEPVMDAAVDDVPF